MLRVAHGKGIPLANYAECTFSMHDLGETALTRLYYYPVENGVLVSKFETMSQDDIFKSELVKRGSLTLYKRHNPVEDPFI